MSILNVFAAPDCALVGVDTEYSLAATGYGEMSKMFPLPHINSVLAFRGAGIFVMLAVAQSIAAGGSFDDLASRLPKALTVASNQAVSCAPKLGVSPDFAGCAEVVLVGFSPASGRIVCHAFKCATLDDGFVATYDIDRYVSPYWNESGLDFESLGICADKAGLEALALTQSRIVRERSKEASAGGRLIVAEIKHGSMHIGHLCDFPARIGGDGGEVAP